MWISPKRIVDAYVDNYVEMVDFMESIDKKRLWIEANVF